MFFCGKKIVYLNNYKNDIKGSLVGFVRCVQGSDVLQLDVTLQKLYHWEDGKYLIMLESDEKGIVLGEINLRKGEGKTAWKFPVKGDYLYCGEKEILLGSVYGITIQNHNDERVIGYWKTSAREYTFLENSAKDHNDENENFPMSATEVKEEIIKPIYLGQEKVENYFDNKWQQLCETYPKVHPFGDGREFISIELKDFVLLRATYQKLINNSFLLHGYYNYKHLILGPSAVEKQEKSFHLGVPGSFYEREKMVAVMFGFEGFECNGPVEIGKFGYYMRRVEL